MAFAAEPGQEPSIALAVFVEFGEGGSSAAGPIARKMLEAYFGMNKPKPAAPARTAEDYRELLPEENINAVV
jgi:penicillin-binding protein 2